MNENLRKLTDVLCDKLEKYLANEKTVFVVGFSGGRDSLALLYALHLLIEGKWRGRCGLLAAHFNHNLRGVEAAADEEFCRQFCQERSIEFVAEQAADLHHGMSNVEQRARHARYAWFEEWRRRLKSDGKEPYLLTAHHLEDQAETVLLHLMRGSGTAGLAAMSEQNGWHLRPLLGVSRGLLQSALADDDMAWCDDSTNADTEYTRNFVRMRIMPLIREVNPQADRALAQAAEIASEEEAYFDSVIKEKMAAVRVDEGCVSYAWADFAAEPYAIKRRLVRALWLLATGRAFCPLSFGQIDRVLQLSAGQGVNLSGAVWAGRRGKLLIMRIPTDEEMQYRRNKSRKGQ